MQTENSDSTQPTIGGSLARHKVLTIAIVALCAALGAWYGSRQPSLTTATASLVVQDPRSTALFGGSNASANYTADQAAILRLPSLAATASAAVASSRRIAPIPVTTFITRTKVKASTDSDLITVAYSDQSSATAQAGANSLVTAYRNLLTSQASGTKQQTLSSLDAAITQLDQRIAAATAQLSNTAPLTTASSAAQQAALQQQATLQSSLAQLLNTRAQVLIDAGNGSSGLAAVSPARLPSSPSGGNTLRFGLLGALVGLLPAAALAYFVTSRRRRFRDRFEPEPVLHAPLITEVPKFSLEKLPSDLPAFDRPQSAAAEAFRFALASFSVRQTSARAVSYAVVSSDPSAGKSTLAANLALSAAQEGRRVLALDADLEGGGLSWLLLGEDRQQEGLVQVMDGRRRFEDLVVSVPVGEGSSVDVLCPGSLSRGAKPLFDSADSREFFRSLSQRYDMVFVDTPPLLRVAYAGSILALVDEALVVVKHGSSVDGLAELEERLRFLGITSVGYLYSQAPLRKELGQHSRLVVAAGEESGPVLMSAKLDTDKGVGASR